MRVLPWLLADSTGSNSLDLSLPTKTRQTRRSACKLLRNKGAEVEASKLDLNATTDEVWLVAMACSAAVSSHCENTNCSENSVVCRCSCCHPFSLLPTSDPRGHPEEIGAGAIPRSTHLEDRGLAAATACNQHQRGP